MGLLDFLRGPDINVGVEKYKSTKGAVLLDVRTEEEFAQGHIQGAVNIPLQEISKVIERVTDKSTPLFTYCLSGARSSQATAICAGLKADVLKDLDLAYAPPYSSAKDPVNMVGFMIENLNTEIVKQFHWDEVDSLPRDGSVTLLDTRTVQEYSRGHVDGFANIPVDDLRERLNEIDKDKPLYVMCQSGLRSYISCRILAQEGYNCYNFSGGYRFYERINSEKKSSDYSYPCGMDK